MNHEIMEEAAAFVQSRWSDLSPAAGMILGSGWGDVVGAFTIEDEILYEEIPGLGKPGVAGHAGRLVRATAAGREALIFQGRRHFYEGEGWTAIALPVFVLKACGAPIVVLTNAAGGIRDEFSPGDLMIIEDHINHMHSNPLIGEHDPTWGVRFPDQSNIYDTELRSALKRAADAAGVPIQRGVYLAASGPYYETPTEIRSYRTLGADAVGMSTVPEAALANAAGLRVVALSCISNLAAGISKSPLTHEEVTETTQAAMQRMTSVLAAFWKEVARHG
jgi:purine-nucleoside phosphorylase